MKSIEKSNVGYFRPYNMNLSLHPSSPLFVAFYFDLLKNNLLGSQKKTRQVKK